ncbi:MAG: OprD family outer membrane porin [Flammeovirgaceae bacterium]|nr:OprD family outer membrane porin [Flammeovirgaceae bacterium]
MAQSDSLFNAISKGKVSGYWRSFLMATDNQAPLQDWNAIATGGLLKYESGLFNGFSIGVGFYYTMDIHSNISQKDTSTNKYSRYELGLYDFNDPDNREIPLLGEAYISYKKNNHQIKFGRFKLKTPFLNPEDGRMIPTLEQGFWYQFNNKKNISTEFGWLTHIGTRSTSEFQTIANSIGSYPQGLNTDGTKGNYKGNLTSKGMGVVSICYFQKNWMIKVWNYYVENIFNSSFLETSYLFEQDQLTHKFLFQYLNQNKLKNGGNNNAEETYFFDKNAQLFGLKYQTITSGKWTFSANWNYITDHGRFQFPREWGRESLFVFQKRERLEGMADSHAWMVDIQKNFSFKKDNSMVVKLGYGQYFRPDAKNFAQNKYAMPANDQLNLDIFYFSKPNKTGLIVEGLIAFKSPLGNTYNNPNLVLNKVNMVNYNLVVNYVF